MKKLLAILVITLLAIPMFAGTDILNFMWFENKIGFAFSDGWNLPSANVVTGTGTDTQWNARGTDKGVNYYNFLEQFMCGMWGTAYDGDPVKIKMDFFNYFTCEMGDFTSLDNAMIQLNERIQFKGIIDIGSMYSLALGAKGFMRIFPLATIVLETDSNSPRWGFMGISMLLENTIKIPNILNIVINGEFMFLQWGAGKSDNRGINTAENHTDLDIFLTAGLNGSYPFGFSWSVTQDVILVLNLENVAGNDPAGADGTIIGNYHAQPAFFSNCPYFATTLNLTQDILSLVGVKDVSLKVSVDQKLVMLIPYAGGVPELTKTINTQGVYGVTVGFYGFSIGAFMTLATEDSYNTSITLDGSTGSATANPYTAWGTGTRTPGRGQLGVLVKVGYSRGFFAFDFAYHGQGNIRDYDYVGDNFGSVQTVGTTNSNGLNVDNGGLFRMIIGYARWYNMISCSVTFKW